MYAKGIQRLVNAVQEKVLFSLAWSLFLWTDGEERDG
jgi:hypothetical protein